MPGMFIHTLYFWLTDDAGKDVRNRMLADCTELLAKIPSARHVWAGTPAMTPRPVVDNSYTLGLCVACDDAKGHDQYQAHPLHVEFGNRYKRYWNKVQVYDFL
jgi:hypothetical protein